MISIEITFSLNADNYYYSFKVTAKFTYALYFMWRLNISREQKLFRKWFFHANSSFDLLLDVQQEHIKELEKTVADLKGIFNCKSYLWRRYLKYVLIRSCATLLVLQCKAI